MAPSTPKRGISPAYGKPKKRARDFSNLESPRSPTKLPNSRKRRRINEGEQHDLLAQEMVALTPFNPARDNREAIIKVSLDDEKFPHAQRLPVEVCDHV
jgi:hypothetical protein